MPRHKTAHRKRLEAHSKEQATLRAEAVKELKASGTLKPYGGSSKSK